MPAFLHTTRILYYHAANLYPLVKHRRRHTDARLIANEAASHEVTNSVSNLIKITDHHTYPHSRRSYVMSYYFQSHVQCSTYPVQRVPIPISKLQIRTYFNSRVLLKVLDALPCILLYKSVRLLYSSVGCLSSNFLSVQQNFYTNIKVYFLSLFLYFIESNRLL